MTAPCASCSRRGWLLQELATVLDLRARDHTRFWELLALDDLDLIHAIGGRRRDALLSAYERLQAADADGQPLEADRAHCRPPDVEGVCVHRRAYPRALAANRLAPRALYVRGGLGRMHDLLRGTAVAIVGTRAASDHGLELAYGLAGDLAACGVTVIGALSDGVARAAHMGALRAAGPTLTVMGAGVEQAAPASCASVYRALTQAGCVVSELACGSSSRPWSELGRMRTVVLASELVVVVEAWDRPRELACARLAWSLGKQVAALPGRVSAGCSAGSNLLIREGATLVRGAEDVLETLSAAGVSARSRPPGSTHPRVAPPLGSRPRIAPALGPHLQAVLDAVAQGRDTIAKLSAGGTAEPEATSALGELELTGRLVRGDGGRYVPVPGVAQDRVRS